MARYIEFDNQVHGGAAMSCSWLKSIDFFKTPESR